ncbi:MAG: hypothetical protein Q9219_001015 [cf. Caloplaca sp. 3 TL-2023]
MVPAEDSISSDVLHGTYSSSSASPQRSTSITSVAPFSEPTRKRKRSAASSSSSSSESLVSVAEYTSELEAHLNLAEESEKRQESTAFFGVRPPPLVYPKSLYVGEEPRLSSTKERLVLKEVLGSEAGEYESFDDSFISVDLEDFRIYRPHKTFPRKESKISKIDPSLLEKPGANELVSLNELNSRSNDYFFLDGTICFGYNCESQRSVQQVCFETLSIGGYEDTGLHTVGWDIWLQSVAGKSSDIWYRLKRPATEYARYHEPFLWLADLAKHVVDFLLARDGVCLQDFRSAFGTWLHIVHGLHPGFLSWQRKHPSKDFRHIVVANATFLYNQAGQLGSQYIRHPLWSEIDPAALSAVPRRPARRNDPRTVVTPYVYDCFNDMPWAHFMDPLASKDKQEWFDMPIFSRRNQLVQSVPVTSEVGTGEVIAIPIDQKSKWKTNDRYWYAYVQGRKPVRQGHELSLIWIYRPADTACRGAKYPYPKELFFSDHCNCGDSPVYSTDVAYNVSVAMFGHPETTAEYFIRQTYSSTEPRWTTLQPSHFRCQCDGYYKPPENEYVVGDTLLMLATLPTETLEPVVLVEKAPAGDTRKVRVRRLLRKRDDLGDSDADPNELVYTTQLDVCNVELITRRCHVRIYTPEERQASRIPAPYNRRGTGDCYYILWQRDHPDDQAMQMNLGFDPSSAGTGEPLRGLDIFCGGGSLGRGLEEAGAVKMKSAVDFFNEAIHTYHANSDQSIKLFNGSVNDYLAAAIKGRGQDIARRGEVDLICAGSPCQGFSIANRFYVNDRSLLNISLVASVIAFVDFYRPRYVIMENVLAMANCGPKRAQNNVFAQVLCALVGLGYQVQPMILDSWNFGAPQHRSRLFVTAAAPGFTPLKRPEPSHSHPDSALSRSLGKAANGLPFGSREWTPTPFAYVSIGEATEDLPENPDGRTMCISCPDHRVTRNFSTFDNVRLSCVPRFPPGMTFVKSAKLGWQPPPQMASWHWETDLRSSVNSKAWQRAKANALLPTVTTHSRPNDAIAGSGLHWDAQRCLTVMEARRAQGFPDDEVLVGSPAMQWKIIGNSVTRQVATALGIGLREALLADQPSNDGPQQVSPLEAFDKDGKSKA